MILKFVSYKYFCCIWKLNWNVWSKQKQCNKHLLNNLKQMLHSKTHSINYSTFNKWMSRKYWTKSQVKISFFFNFSRYKWLFDFPLQGNKTQIFHQKKKEHKHSKYHNINYFLFNVFVNVTSLAESFKMLITFKPF